MTADKNEKVKTEATNSTFQIVVFKLGEEEYGLHIDQIKEVVITPPITRMPQTQNFIKGVANIRGNIIAILDLEEKFGLKRNSEDPSRSNFTLVIESEDFKMGVLVKEVPNTLSISSSDVEESVFSGDHAGEQNYIKGIVKLNKRLVIMIDIFKVITSQEVNTALKKGTTAEIA